MQNIEHCRDQFVAEGFFCGLEQLRIRGDIQRPACCATFFLTVFHYGAQTWTPRASELSCTYFWLHPIGCSDSYANSKTNGMRHTTSKPILKQQWWNLTLSPCFFTWPCTADPLLYLFQLSDFLLSVFPGQHLGLFTEACTSTHTAVIPI